MNLKALFYPGTIAVIGASGHPGKVGFAIMRNLNEFKGEIIPVNPKHEVLWARRCYKSVLDYKGGIDLAVIAIPAQFVAGVLKECGKKGIKNAIVITAGFSEIGNVKGEKEIVDAADKYKINLLGPNCFGVSNPYNRVDTTFAKTKADRGEIAFVSQSGALWSYISDLASGKFGFSKFASLGNPVGLDFHDLIEYLGKDTKTKAIVLYVEKISNGKEFLKVAKKCRTPIYAVKAGSTKEGSKAAVSHTGSLATDYEIYRGAFKQAGVVLCTSLERAFEKASGKKLVKARKKKLCLGKRVVIITNAGGAGALATDYCAEAGLKVCGVYDILGAASAFDYKKALSRFGRKSDSIVVIATPQVMTAIGEIDRAVRKFKGKKIVRCYLGDKSVKGFGDFNTLEEFRASLLAKF